MVILLLFNNTPKMTFKEIKDATQIPVPDLKRNLLPLVLGKYKILNKSEKSKEIEEEDVFSFNSKFTCKLFRVKVMTVAREEDDEQRTDTRQKVDEDRKLQYPNFVMNVSACQLQP